MGHGRARKSAGNGATWSAFRALFPSRPRASSQNVCAAPGERRRGALGGWWALAMALDLCLPCFLISVACEYFVVQQMLTKPARQVRRWAWQANLLSYTV